MTTPLDPTPDDVFLRPYYWQFEPTGLAIIDGILEQISRAGKAYHHTEWWGEPTIYGDDNSPSYWERIQAAADAAAAVIRAAHASDS
jgi:hypothetical protein